MNHKLKKLILVAGPTCAGKSTLISTFKRGELNPLSRYLNVKPDNYLHLGARELPFVEWRETQSLLLHYDIHDQLVNNAFRFLDELFQHFTQIDVLILKCDRKSIFSRITIRLIKHVLHFRWIMKTDHCKRIIKLVRKQVFYLNKSRSAELYNKFEMYISDKPLHNLVYIDTSGSNPVNGYIVNKKITT